MVSVQSNERGYFICQRRDQLGARLLMILNCIRLSEDFGFDYLINWFPRNAAAPKLARPEELFSDAYLKRHFISNDDYERMANDALPLHEFFNDLSPDRLIDHLQSGKHVTLEEGFEIAVFRWEEKSDIEMRYRGFMDRIDLNPLVRGKISELDRIIGVGEDNSVSYHVRRGDILNEIPWKHGMWPSKIEPDELYLTHLEVTKPETALVFSDLDECVDRLRKGSPKVRGISELISVSECSPCQRDFLELYAMSRTARIVAPVISAFSSAAARLSGQDRMRFVDVLDSPQIDKAYDQVAKRLQGDLGSFANLSEAAHIFSRLSRHLAVNDRELEAYKIGKRLIEAGADNAFLPLLHAINCVYLSKWQEAQDSLDLARASPELWKEDHASALALSSHVEAALGNAVSARRLWLRAFWAKPHLPDIILTGSALVERHRLKSGADLPVDLNLLRSQRLPYIQRGCLTVQRKLIKQKAIDFSLLVIEWHHLVLDRKAKRLLADRVRLKRIRALVSQHEGDPGFDSFRGLIQSFLGRHRSALQLTAEAQEQSPDDFLVNKRRAEALWAADRKHRALSLLKRLADSEEDNPFAHFLYAKHLEMAGNGTVALRHYELAAKHDASTPAIHAALADCQSAQNQLGAAVKSLTEASVLAPTFQKFVNQRDRLQRRIANSG